MTKMIGQKTEQEKQQELYNQEIERRVNAEKISIRTKALELAIKHDDMFPPSELKDNSTVRKAEAYYQFMTKDNRKK